MKFNNLLSGVCVVMMFCLLMTTGFHQVNAAGYLECRLDSQKLLRGSKGSSVKKLQRILALYNDDDSMNIDGVFGRGTKTLVMNFQSDHDLKADGVVGATTQRYLMDWCENYQSEGETGPSTYQGGSGIFGTTTSLSKGSSVVYPDGLKVEVFSTNDSRCKIGLTCVWEGEVSALLRVSGGMIPGATYKEIRMGTVGSQKISEYGYTFKIEDGSTKESIFLNVSLMASPAAPQIPPYQSQTTQQNTPTNTNTSGPNLGL